MATDSPRRCAFLVLAIAGSSAVAPAQELRKALANADAVLVGRQVGKEQATAEIVVHRVQVLQAVRGVAGAVTTVNVLDWPGLSLHNRPAPRQSRLYCLQDASKDAALAGLPADRGTYYRMTGWPGSSPMIGADLAVDPVLRLARTLAAAETGTDPAATTAAIADLALCDDRAIRLEATRLLAERPDLRTRLSPLVWSRVLSRTSGEIEDVDYKIALAELCAEQGVDGLVDALVVGLGQVHAPVFARTVGRLAARLRGEDAATPMLDRLRTAMSPDERAALLLAIGATRTQGALNALVNLRATQGADAALDAALAEHKSRQAREATLQGKTDKKQ